MVKWLECCAYNQQDLGSKPTSTPLLCPWKRYLEQTVFPAWWSWQAVLNYSHIFIKLQTDCNILASPKEYQGNCLPYVLVLPLLSYESEG